DGTRVSLKHRSSRSRLNGMASGPDPGAIGRFLALVRCPDRVLQGEPGQVTPHVSQVSPLAVAEPDAGAARLSADGSDARREDGVLEFGVADLLVSPGHLLDLRRLPLFTTQSRLSTTNRYV